MAFVSERDAGDDVDLWVMPLPGPTAAAVALGDRPAAGTPATTAAPRPTRVTRVTGTESHPAWSPDGRTLIVAGVPEPIVGRYRGHVLYAGGPPVSTGIQLFESLQVLNHYTPRPGARPSADADYFHHLLEARKVRDPLRRVADRERWPVDFAEHLRGDHALTLFKKIDPTRASTFERPTDDDGPFNPPATRIGRGTTWATPTAA